MKLQKKNFKNYSILTLGTNILSIFMGIIYFIVGAELIFGVFFEIILIITWCFDMSIVLLDENLLVKNNLIGKKINRFNYCFLSVQIISLLLIFGGNFLMNGQWGNTLIYYSLMGTGYFLLFIFGGYLAYLNVKGLNMREAWKIE